MMKKEIIDAYESMKPTEDAKQRMRNNILSSASKVNSSRKENNIMQLKAKHFLRAAAILAVILIIPTVAYATGLFGLNEISLGKKKIEVPIQTENTDTPLFGEIEVDMISLQGVSDSPEYRACHEWTDFTDSYDTDGSILSQIGNNTVGLGVYEDIYGCYTQEMADKVDELCEKYQLLKLEGFEAGDYQSLCNRLGIGDIGKKPVENAANDVFGGYSYSNGTFQFEGTATITGPSSCITDYQFRRSVKGSFDTVILNIGNIDEYRQWEYTTTNGETVLLANSSGKALIIVEKENSYVVVNFLGDIANDTFDVSDEVLETLAEMFDFSMIS